MEISLARSLPVLRLLLKSWYVRSTIANITRSRSTVEVAHRIYGNVDGNAPIIILHGFLGSKKNWESMSKKIQEANDKTVIAVDARNHGESPHAPSHKYVDLAGDIKRLMDKHYIKEAIIMGHSMGGRTAMVLALTEPTKVSNLIVVDVSPVTNPGLNSNFFPRLLDVMKSVDFDGVKDVPSGRILAKHKIKDSGLDLDIGTMNFILMNVGAREGIVGWMCNVNALSKHIKEIASFPPEVSGKVYQGPTLFIAGEDSHYVPKEDYNVIKSMFPLLEMEYVEDAGHNVHVDQPDVFRDTVTRFISEYTL